MNYFLSRNSFYCNSNPSTSLFLWEDVKKFEHSLIQYFSSSLGIAAAMKQFLNWLLGPSDHNCKTLTVLSISSDINLSMKVITESFRWIKLSEITTADLQVSWHQTTDISTVTCFLFQCADCTSSCHSVEKFSAKSTWRAAVSWLPFYDLHMFWIAIAL